MSNKGISLPVNALVIIALAVIVLLVVVAMTMGVIPSFNVASQKDTALKSCCNQFVLAGGCEDEPVDTIRCTVSNEVATLVDSDGNTAITTIKELSGDYGLTAKAACC